MFSFFCRLTYSELLFLRPSLSSTVSCGTESGQYAHNVFRMFDVQHNGYIRFEVSRSVCFLFSAHSDFKIVHLKLFDIGNAI